MQNSKIIARETLKELLKSGKDPTPEAYAEAYYLQAKKMGVPLTEADLSIDKILEMLDKEAKEGLFNRSFKSKNELLIAIVKSINSLFFAKKNFGTSLDILKLLLRILATYPQREISTLAKGQLIEIDKLNAKTMQIWREHWMEKAKKNVEFDFLDCLKGIEILSNFEISNPEFQKWQSYARHILKGKPSKEEQIKVLSSLEEVLKKMQTQEVKEEVLENPAKNANPKSQSITPPKPKIPTQYSDVLALPIDATTTLMSKEGMREVLNFAEEVFVKKGENYAVIVFGIAAYDKIKQHFGLEAAKRILATLGRLLKQYSNASDLIAYYGDEEFLACLLDREKEEAIQFIYRLDKIVQQSKFMFQQTRIEISLSAQVSHRVEEKDLESMLKMRLEEFVKHKDSQGIIRYEE